MQDTHIKRILLVEDEAHLVTALRLNFEMEGYAVEAASSAREGCLLLAQPRPFDLIVLDVMLPDLSGLALCRRLRAAGNFTPILMLTARASLTDRALGLDSGADDYLAKPFALEELLARIRSLLRRRAWEQERTFAPHLLRVGAANIDFQSFVAHLGDQTFPLTPLEVALLRYFVARPGRVISREELVSEVWQLPRLTSMRTVDNFVMRLRRYIEPDAQRVRILVSIRGAGYRYNGEYPGQ